MSWDESFLRAVNGLAGHAWVIDQFFLIVGYRSTFYIPLAFAIIYWIWSNRREALFGGTLLVGVVGLVDYLSGQLKRVVERVRPCRALSNLVTVEPGGCGGLFSFPSSHAMNTATAAAFLHVLYPRSGWVSWPVVALIGFSRVYVGAHYVTDVLGGWVIGGLFGAGAAWLLLRYSRIRASMASPAA
jgi:undecaprenyl-diphosphatase